MKTARTIMITGVALCSVGLTPAAFAGHGAGGVHSTQSGNLERFNDRAAEPAPAQATEKNELYEIQGMAPASGVVAAEGAAPQAGERMVIENDPKDPIEDGTDDEQPKQ